MNIQENTQRIAELLRLRPHFELEIMCFVLNSFNKIRNIGDVLDELGGSLIDISTDANVVEDWVLLGLQKYETHMFAFRTERACAAEIEFVFREGLLGQCGVQFFYNRQYKVFVREMFQTFNKIITLHYYSFQEKANMINFSNNIINGYLHWYDIPVGISVALRLANLEFCRDAYGDNAFLPLS